MSDQAPDDVAGAPTAPSTPPDDAATASAPAPSPPAPPSTPLLPRERAERGPGLGGALAVGVIVAAALPCAALVWLVARGPASSPTPAMTTSIAPVATTPTTATTTGAPDPVALTAALAAVEREALAAGTATRALAERAERAERGARVRATQKLIARARDARRAAGQSGPALKGPFPVAELGDLGELELSSRRWLITRDGAIVAPTDAAGPRPPAPLATTGREEDLASIPATVDGTAATLLRHCVPFEPWCLVDVVPATPPPVTPAVDLAALRALLTASPAASAPPSPPPPTTTTTTPSPAPTATMTTGAPTSGPTWPLLALAGIGLVVAVAVASRLRQLGSLLRAVAWRLRSGLHGRGAAPVGPPALGELAVLEAAVDEAHAAVARLATVDDESARRRTRLEAVGTALQEARTRGGVSRIDADDADDAATARVVAAVNALLETLDARHRRIAMAATEGEGTLRLVTPLSQRLLRLARLEGLPPQAADELTSLGTSLGQRARRPQVLPGLLEDLGPLAPPTSSIVDIAAAVEPLGDEGARLAARQLEGLGRDPQGG
jgi:hypothetical protein